MPDPLDLEISLFRRDQTSYTVELRLNDPEAKEGTERAPERDRVAFPAALLNKRVQTITDAAQYGRQLFDCLLPAGKVRDLYTGARTRAESEGRPLRLRLFIDRDSLALHSVPWETLCDADGHWLVAQEQRPFSRFLGSDTWERVALRAKGQLRALVVIANPTNLQPGQPLAPLKVTEEKQRAQAGLGVLYRDENVLASADGQPGRVTFAAVLDRLREGFDIVYLVCHGTLATRGDAPGPRLVLEKADGTLALEPAADLAERIRNLAPELRPRLFVLASCESAGSGGPAAPAVTADAPGALAAAGPLLAQAGVPAVVAMQGSVSMDTAGQFMQAFFAELMQDGLVDRAMSVARGAVTRAVDRWMPVLFLRLRSGKLWYTPGFGAGMDDLGGLLDGLASPDREAMPVLGFGAIEFLFGTPRQMAAQWAEMENFPLAQHSRQELPQVAQYLTNRYAPGTPLARLDRFIRSRAQAFLGQPPPAPPPALERYLADVSARRRALDPNNGFEILARLPFKIYLVATPDNLLVEALTHNHRPPVVDYFRWNAALEKQDDFPSPYEQARAQGYEPNEAQPLVYHLFGRLGVRESLVLSEDDYFDFMMWVNRPQSSLPKPITAAWRSNSLFFLGFQANDWMFRVLYRSIVNDYRRGKIIFQSVAVQINPEEDTLDPERARRYLETCFTKAKVGVYWGSADEFLQELERRWIAGGFS